MYKSFFFVAVSSCKLVKLNNSCVVYVNPNINCKQYLNSNKFHANYKQFGPDIPKNLFKLILQAFINCAYDSTRIFDLIQDGDSTSYIKCKLVLGNRLLSEPIYFSF